MKVLYTILSNRKVKILLKVIFTVTMFAYLSYFIFQLAFISNQTSSQVQAERQYLYSMIGLGSLLTLFYFVSKAKFSSLIADLRGNLRSALREDNSLDKSERIARIREVELDFHHTYVVRQLVFVLFGAIFYLLIVFTDGILDVIAKVAVVVIAIVYYLKFQEDPIELLNSKKYDRQRIDEESAVAIIRAENWGKGGI